MKSIFKILTLFIFLTTTTMMFSSSASASDTIILNKATDVIKKHTKYTARCSYIQPSKNNPAFRFSVIGHEHFLHFGPCTAKDRKMFWSKEYAGKRLRKLARSHLNNMRDLVKTKLNTNMNAALTSLVHSIGINNFKSSLLLKQLNKKDFCGASRQFKRWAMVNGKKDLSLVSRRKSETKLFISDKKGSPSKWYLKCLL